MSDPTPINRFKPFGPGRFRQIVKAFDEACAAFADQPPSDKVRDILAKRITELAQFGDWDYARLRDQALEHARSVVPETVKC